MSTTYHSQPDCTSEIMNRMLENLLSLSLLNIFGYRFLLSNWLIIRSTKLD